MTTKYSHSGNMKILEYDARRAAFHEAAHYLVASHFKLSASIWMRENDGIVPENSNTVIGRVFYNPTTSFRKCAIAWGGLVGDILCGNDEFQSVTDLSGEAWNDYENGYVELSQTDENGIASHSQRRRALNLTCVIVYSRRS